MYTELIRRFYLLVEAIATDTECLEWREAILVQDMAISPGREGLSGSPHVAWIIVNGEIPDGYLSATAVTIDPAAESTTCF